MEAIVEFVAKLHRTKVKTEEDLALEEFKRLTDSDYKPEELVEVGFKHVLIDLFNITEPIELDEGFVQVVMKYGTTYVIRIHWEEFKDLYQTLTHRMIHTLKDN